MDLIRSTLEAIKNQLNDNLLTAEPRSDEWVVLTSPAGPDGKINEKATDKIIMSVYNIEKDTTISNSPKFNLDNNQYYAIFPPIYINVYLIFMANFSSDHYKTGLGGISHVISFFQKSPFFTHDNCRGLPREVTKIVVEFENIDPINVNSIMGMLGTKYTPSIFYKLRMLQFHSVPEA